MSACLITLELNGSLKFSNGFVKPSKSAKTHSHVETGLIDIFVIRKSSAGFLVIIDGIFQLIELRLYKRSIVIVGSVGVVFLHCALVMSQRIFILAKLIVTLSAKIPVLSNCLGFSIGRSLRVKLNGHGEIRNGTSEVSLALVNSSLQMVGSSKIYH